MAYRKRKPTNLLTAVILLVIFLPIAYFVSKNASPSEAAWFDDTFAYRQTVPITNSGAAQTDFQVAITLNTSALVTAGKMQSDCDDIRITDLSGKILPYWFSGCNTTTTKIWPKVPSLPTTGAMVYLYYGNLTATAGKTKVGTQSYPGLSCKTILDAGDSAGIGNYWIDPTNGNTSDSFQAYCDMTNDSGGWMLVTQNMIQSEANSDTSNVKTADANGGLINTITLGGVLGCTSKSYQMLLKDTIPWTKIKADYEYYGGNSCWGVFGNGSQGPGSNLISYQAGTDTIRNQVKMGGSAGDNFDGTTSRCDNETTNFWHANQGNVTRSAQAILRRNSMGSFAGLSNGVACTGYTNGWKYQNIYIREDSMEPANITVASPTNEEKSPAPVAYWKFDEGYGVTANDSTQNTTNGTLMLMSSPPTGSSGWQTEDKCISGKCIGFDGTDDYVSITSSNATALKNDTNTISAWFNIRAYGPNAYAELYAVTGGNRTGIKINPNSIGMDANADFYNTYVTTETISLNSWHYVVAIIDRSANTFSVYLDGKYKGQDTFTPYTPTATVVKMGAISLTGNVGDYFKGFIDEPKIYSYARTAAQIKSDYNSRGSFKGSSVQMGSSNKNLDALSNGLVGYWKMDESTTPSIDSSGNGQNGTWTGNAISATGKFGNAISLDGVGDYVSIADPGTSPLDLPGAWSISAWTFVNNTETSYGHIVGKRGTGDNYTFRTNGDASTWECYFDRSGWQGAWNKGTVHKNTWHYMTCVYDGVNTIKIYEDGLEIGSAAVGVPPTPDNNPVEIGSWTGGSEALDGKLDEVRIYNRALSPAEVTSLYNWAPGPLAYYDFEEGSGAIANDKSGNGHTGTINSGPSWTTGQFGKGLAFSGGSSQDVTVTGMTGKLDKTLTVEAWVDYQGITTSGFDRVLGRGWVGNGWLLGVYDSGGVDKTYCGIGQSSVQYAVTSTTVTPGKYHLALTYDGTTLRCYVNGAFTGQNTSIPNATFDTSSNIVIGDVLTDNIKIDEVKIYNYARTSGQITEDMNAGHPMGGSPVGSQIAYYKFDEGYGATANNSGYGGSALNAAFGTSTAAPSWVNAGKFGKALNFTNVNNTFVRAPITTSNGLNIRGAITYSVWFKRNGLTDYQTLVDMIDDCGSVNTDGYLLRFYNSTLNFSASINDVSGADPFYLSYTNANTTGDATNWHQAVTTWDGTTNTNGVKMYIDGVQVAQTTAAADATNMETLDGHSLSIGTLTCNVHSFDGNIDEVKIYNAALTAEEIKLDYSQGAAIVIGTSNQTISGTTTSLNYCIPGDTTSCAAPIAEWKMEEKTGTNAYDTSGNGNTGIWNGTGTHWATGKVGASGQFNGSNDYVNLPEPLSGLPAGSTVYTVEAWFKRTGTLAEVAGTIISMEGVGIYNRFDLDSTDVKWYYYDGTQSVISSPYSVNNWYHIVGIRNGNVFSFYLNGNYVGSLTGNGSYPAGTNNYFIGSRLTGGGSSYFFNGLIDQVRIYDYARTPAQIAWDYNRGAPVGQWKLDECQGGVANDSSSNGNSGTITIGATVPQTSPGTCTDGLATSAWYNGRVGKYNSSLNFDGVDDFVNTGINSSLNINKDITISSWIMANSSVSTYRAIVSKEEVAAANCPYRLMLVQSNGLPLFDFWGGASGSLQGTIALNDNVWHHLVATRDDTNKLLKIYIDGKLNNQGSYSGSINQAGVSEATWIGRSPYLSGSYPFYGKIDDVRLYNYALTPTQVKTLYNNNASIQFAPLTGSPQ